MAAQCCRQRIKGPGWSHRGSGKRRKPRCRNRTALFVSRPSWLVPGSPARPSTARSPKAHSRPRSGSASMALDGESRTLIAGSGNPRGGGARDAAIVRMVYGSCGAGFGGYASGKHNSQSCHQRSNTTGGFPLSQSLSLADAVKSAQEQSRRFDLHRRDLCKTSLSATIAEIGHCPHSPAHRERRCRI